MLKHVFERHTGKREARAMARTGAEADRAEGRREGRRAGRREGAAEALQAAVLEVLRARFVRVRPTLARAVRAVKDRRTLRALVRRAAAAESLDVFAEALAPRGGRTQQT